MTMQARLAVYEPNGARLGTLPTPVDVEASFPLGDTGALAFKYAKTAPRADWLTSAKELAVEVSHDKGATWAEPWDARFRMLRREGDPTDTVDVVSRTAIGYRERLSKARILPEGKLNADNKRPFLSATPGNIMATLFQEAQARGALSGMSMDFTSTHDSAGVPWASQLTLYFEPGLDYLSVLQNLEDQGVADAAMEARKLRLFNPDTARARDLAVAAEPVILRTGIDVVEAPYKGTLEDLADFAYLEGDEGFSKQVTNAQALAPWGRQETYITQGGVSDDGTATLLIQSELDRAGRERVENTYGLLFAGAKFQPFRNYKPGDYVLVTVAGSPERLRVRQITIAMDANGNLAGSAVLNDRFLESEVRQARRVQGITGGSTVSGGSGSRPAPAPELDKRVPKTPLQPGLASDAYLDSDKNTRALVTITWPAVTEATDGSALEIGQYRVDARPAGGLWRRVDTVDGTQTTGTLDNLDPGKGWDFRVAAVAKESGRVSAWSPLRSITTAVDATPPEPPSKPTFTTWRAVGTIGWDGLDETGAAMAADTRHTVVYRGLSATNTPDAVGTPMPGAGTQTDPDLEYGITYWYRLRAVDRSGNWSDFSAATSAVVTPLVDADLFDTTIEERISTAVASADASEAAAIQAVADANAAEAASVAAQAAAVAAEGQAGDSVAAAEAAAAAAEADRVAAVAAQSAANASKLAADTAKAQATQAAADALAAQQRATTAEAAAEAAEAAASASEGTLQDYLGTAAIILRQAATPAAEYQRAGVLWIKDLVDTDPMDGTSWTWDSTLATPAWVQVKDATVAQMAADADASADAALAAKAAADLAKSQATTAATNAGNSASAASAAQTQASNSASAASAAQTQAGNSATAATNSANAAAASKTAADQAKADALAAAARADNAEAAADAAAQAAGASSAEALLAREAAEAAQLLADTAKADAERLWASAVRSYSWNGERMDALTVSGAPMAIVNVADAPASGSVLRKTGDSGGTVEWNTDPMPFDPGALYRITFKVRVVTNATDLANPYFYGGIHAWAAAANGGPGWVITTTGTANTSAAHYFAASAETPKAADGWVTYTGYFQGTGADAGGEHQDMTDPGVMHPNTRYISPMAFLDYNGGNGTWDVGMVAIDVIPAELAAMAKLALDNAATAKARADAAHTLAGTAEDTATSALNAANGVSRNYSSSSAPSGVAPAKSIWWRFGSDGGVIGVWEQTTAPEGSNWVNRPVRSEAIDSLDVGKLSASAAGFTQAVAESFNATAADFLRARADWFASNQIESDWIGAGQIEAQHMTLSSVPRNALQFQVDDMMPFPTWPTAAQIAAGLDLYGPDQMATPYVYSTQSTYLRHGQDRVLAAQGHVFVNQASAYLTDFIPASGGEKVYLYAEGHVAGSTPDWDLRLRCLPFNAAGGVVEYTTGTALDRDESVWYNNADPLAATRASLVYTLPAGTTHYRVNMYPSRRAALDYASLTGTWIINKISVKPVMASTGSTGRSVELSPQGVRLFNEDGGEVVSLTSVPPNYLGILDGSGNTLASLSDDGTMAGHGLNVETDPVILGDNLLGDLADFEAVGNLEPTGILSPLPRGIAAFTDQNVQARTTTGERELAEVSYEHDRTRIYRMHLEPLAIYCDPGSEYYYIRIYYTTDGSAPSMNSPQLRQITFRPESRSVAGIFNFSGTFYHIASTSYTMRLLITMGKTGTTATAMTVFNSYHGGTLRFWVEDAGNVLTDTGMVRNGNRNGDTAPAPAPPATPVKRNYTKTYSPTGYRSYLGSGGHYNYQTSRMYQGESPYGSNGVLRSIATFPSFTGDLSGATITSVRAYFYFDHWYNNSGGNAQIMMHGASSVPSTRPTLTYATTSSGWPKPGGRWVNIPSNFWAGIKSGTYKGVGLGNGTGGNAYYGYARGSATRIEIKYTK